MPVRSSFEIKGLDAYLETLVNAEKDVDVVVADVLTEAKPIIEKKMHANLRRTSEQWTGATAETLYVRDVQREGNYIFLEAGADTGKDPSGFYKEFGTARQAAEPFMRPSFTELRRTGLKRMMKQVLERFGLKTS